MKGDKRVGKDNILSIDTWVFHCRSLWCSIIEYITAWPCRQYRCLSLKYFLLLCYQATMLGYWRKQKISQISGSESFVWIFFRNLFSWKNLNKKSWGNNQFLTLLTKICAMAGCLETLEHEKSGRRGRVNCCYFKFALTCRKREVKLDDKGNKQKG